MKYIKILFLIVLMPIILSSCAHKPFPIEPYNLKTMYLASYIDENEEKIKSFTDAIAESLQWVEEHSDMEVALSIHQYFKETDINVLANSIKRYRSINVWSANPYLSISEFEHLQDVIIASGELDKYMPYNILVDNKFITKR